MAPISRSTADVIAAWGFSGISFASLTDPSDRSIHLTAIQANPRRDGPDPVHGGWI